MTVLAQATKPDLSPTRHKYRVMVGDEIIGQFSNTWLAADTAHEYRSRGSIVLDMSKTPPKVVYRDGNLLDHEEGK